MNTFGKRLKKQRLKLGLTQSELADKLKVSRSAISNWEVGRNYPDLDVLLSLSQLFSVTVDQLLNEEPALVTIISQDQRGNRKRKMILRVLVPALVFFMCITAYLAYHNTSLIHQPFSKSQTSVVTITDQTTNNWTDTKWNDVTDLQSSWLHTTYTLTNDDGSSGKILVRVVDTSSNKITKTFRLDIGNRKRISIPHSTKKFTIQVSARSGQYVLILQ